MPSQPVVFDKPGTVTLGRNIHDKMIAYVLVVETPYFIKTDATGRARLEGLPAGEYDVKAWQPQAGGTSAVAALRVKTAPEGAAAPALKLELRPAAG